MTPQKWWGDVRRDVDRERRDDAETRDNPARAVAQLRGRIEAEREQHERDVQTIEHAARRLPKTKRTPQEQLDDFICRNPGFVARVADKALALKKNGKDHYSIDMICHALRVEDDTIQRAEGGFRINNNITAPLARRVMSDFPALRGFFETRERRRRC